MMEIVDERNENRKQFCEMGIGETFMYDSEIYMKVNTMQSPAGRTVNAIRLERGNDVRFGDEERVVPVKCKLHIVG